MDTVTSQKVESFKGFMSTNQLKFLKETLIAAHHCQIDSLPDGNKMITICLKEYNRFMPSLL